MYLVLLALPAPFFLGAIPIENLGEYLQTGPNHLMSIFFPQMFNSRTCQLLIGAGARQLVGLKTISVRNLGMDRLPLSLAHIVTAFLLKFLFLFLSVAQQPVVVFSENSSCEARDVIYNM